MIVVAGFGAFQRQTRVDVYGIVSGSLVIAGHLLFPGSDFEFGPAGRKPPTPLTERVREFVADRARPPLEPS